MINCELILELVQHSVYPVENREKQKVTDEIVEMVKDRWKNEAETIGCRFFER